MRSGGGKQKGAGYERKVCQQLSLWMSNQKRKDLFWRSAMSGGRATLGFRKGEKHLSQGGDVSAIDPLGVPLTDRFCIEIKFYRDLELTGFLLGHGKLARFWKEANSAAVKYDKEPMLIAKQNLYPTLVLLRYRPAAASPQMVCWRSTPVSVAVMLFDDILKLRYPWE